MPKLSVNGVELHYEDSGSGPPVVFSHGLLWSGRMYAAQVATLADRHRCITYDHRGQGQSPVSPTAYDMDTLAEDAAALIEKLGALPCHFVGLSMGGFVGLRLAIRRPELLRSLVLIESAADPEPWLNVPKYRAMALIGRIFGYGILVRPIMRIMFGRTFLADPARQAQRDALAAELRALRPAGVEPALAAVIGRRAVAGELARIKTPTLILHGTEDRAIVPARARPMAQAIRGARFIDIPRAGHTSSVEEPQTIAEALAEFFAEAR